MLKKYCIKLSTFSEKRNTNRWGTWQLPNNFLSRKAKRSFPTLRSTKTSFSIIWPIKKTSLTIKTYSRLMNFSSLATVSSLTILRTFTTPKAISLYQGKSKSRLNKSRQKLLQECKASDKSKASIKR